MSRRLLVVLLLALPPGAWLAAQRSSVHLSRLDPSHPEYASDYVEARGFVPWLVTEVPAELQPVPLRRRLWVGSLAMNYGVALLPLLAVWVVAGPVVRLVRRRRGAWRRPWY